MTHEELIKAAQDRGFYAASRGEYIAIRGEKAGDTDAQMLLTADGQLYTVSDGYYWQIGTAEDIEKWLEEE